MAPQLLIWLYALAGAILLSFMKLLCHFSLAESTHNLPAPVAAGTLRGPPQEPVESRTHLNPTELLRFLVLFCQWMLLVAGLSGVQWPETVGVPLQVLAYVWAPASPESASVECLLQIASNAGSRVPMGVAKVIFCLGMPLAMLALLLLLEVCIIAVKRWRHPRQTIYIVDRLISTTMVVVFFFLPSLVRTTFSLFTCVSIDQPVQAPYKATAVGSYWVYDTAQLCYSGYHRGLALGLGIPLLFVIVLGLPAAVAVLMLRNRHQLKDPAFSRHYGFLLNGYKASACYWEAVVMLETIILSAAVVFGPTLGPFYQSLIMTLCMATIMVLLVAVRPYVQRQANVVALQSAGCLLLTAFIAQSFLPYGDVNPGRVYGIIIGAVLLLVNAAFVGFVLWKLAAVIDWNGVKLRLVQYKREAAACIKCESTIPAVVYGQTPDGSTQPNRARRWPKESESGPARL